ncbi:MAG TPA: hypothetical protein VF263_13330 [Longimicrobiaceae bacterium]
MLKRYSSRTDLAGVYRAQNDNPASYCGLDIANTDEPAGFFVPQFRVDVERRVPEGFLNQVSRAMNAAYTGADTHEHFARLVVTRAATEGTNASVYLGDGIFETNCTFDEGQAARMPGLRLANHLKQWAQGKNRVYLVSTPQIAGKNKRAEEEHLADFIHAYGLTLGVAQGALVATENRGFLGPFDSEEEARAGVVAAFLERVPAAVRHLGMDMDAWGAEYLRLCQKSRDRDGQQWHSFGLERVKSADLGKHPAVRFLTGGQRPESGRVYLRLTTGVTQIGTHPPSEVITYG